MPKAILTHKTELYSGKDLQSLTKLVDIKDFPALIEPREAVEVTTLGDMSQTYIKGIRTSAGQLDFTANYTSDSWDTVAGRAGTDNVFELRLSDGSKFNWTGSMDVSLSEGGQNAPVEMVVSIYPDSEVVKDATI